MEEIIRWLAFFGGWPPVAGPLAQGAKELSEEMIERDERAALAQLPGHTVARVRR